MELVVGIEPTTASLRMKCSAIEPHQPIKDTSIRGNDDIILQLKQYFQRNFFKNQKNS